jgi:hypothetical protein
VIQVAFLRIARVVKWQTRTFEGRMPKGVGVQVPPRAEHETCHIFIFLSQLRLPCPSGSQSKTYKIKASPLFSTIFFATDAEAAAIPVSLEIILGGFLVVALRRCLPTRLVFFIPGPKISSHAIS